MMKILRQELLDGFNLSWNDNVKARLLNTAIENEYKVDDKEKVRSQFAMYDYYLQKLEN